MRNNHTRERLAHLESASDQQQKEIERLYVKARAAELMREPLEKLIAWQNRVHERTRRAARAGLWVAGSIGVEVYSGAWSQVAGGLLKQLARGG